MATAEQMERARQVKARYERELLGKTNVVAVGVGYAERGGQGTGEIGIVVSVSQKVSREGLDPRQVIPRELEGVRVDVRETGEIRTFD